MRVLISGLSAAKHPSGICRTVVNLTRGLKEADPRLEVVVAIGAWQKNYFEEKMGLNARDAKVLEIAMPNSSVNRNAWYLFGLPRLAKRLDADLVHLAFPAPFIRRGFPCPVVLTLHDLYPYDKPENFGYPRVFFNRAFLRRSLEGADCVMCVSEATRKQLYLRFPIIAESKCLSILNSIDFIQSASSDVVGYAVPYLLAVAQHRANKNLGLLLHAFVQCKSQGVLDPRTHLVIVGNTGPETPGLHAMLRRLSIGSDVVFLSDKADVEMEVLYRGCELFLSLSDVEGFDLPVGEALLCRARVVASDIPVHHEIAGDHCQYVNVKGDHAVASVVDAVKAALRRQRPPSDVVAHLSPPAVGHRFLSAYRTVLEAATENSAITTNAVVPFHGETE